MHKHRPTLESLSRDVAALAQSVHCIHELLKEIRMNQTEMAAALNKLGDQLTKVGGETTQLLADIAALKTQIANADVTPDLQAAFDKVAAQAQKVDDMVPDAPPPA